MCWTQARLGTGDLFDRKVAKGANERRGRIRGGRFWAVAEDVLRVEVGEPCKVRRIDLVLGVVLVEEVLESDSRPCANPPGDS